jgi:hypothetical protein
LVLGKPAGGHQINRTVQIAAGLAGITEHVIAHDLRRGGVRDVINLTRSAIKGEVGRLVAKAVGHSESALSKGITDAYAGHLKANVWKSRLDEAEREEFGATVLARPFKRQKADTQEIDIYRDENGLDKANARDRVRAGKGIREQEKKKWTYQERNGTIDDATAATAITGKKTIPYSTCHVLLTSYLAVLTARSLSKINEQSVSSHTDILLKVSDVDKVAGRQPPDADPTTIIDPNLIDPMIMEPTAASDDHNITMAEESAGIEDGLMGLDISHAAKLAAGCDPLKEPITSMGSELGASPLEFFRFFAQINVVASEHPLDKTAYYHRQQQGGAKSIQIQMPERHIWLNHN